MNKARWTLPVLMILALGLTLIAGSGCTSDSGEKAHAKQYTCSMHPEVVKDSPGKCPKCGMELVEKK
jgi:hypothetical protein